MNVRPEWLRTAGLAALLAATASGAVLAQYAGPGARNSAPPGVARTVAEVLADPRDDRPVELTGMIIRQTGRELYLFRDASGEITVEIDDEDFPANKPVDDKTEVKVRGEVDSRPMRDPRVEVERLELATAATAGASGG